MNSKEKINRAYIDSKLSNILEPMVNQLFLEKPTDYVDFMLKYLKDNYGDNLSINANERMELDYLRKEVAQLKKQVGSQEDHDGSGSEHMSGESEEDDVIDDLPDDVLKEKAKPMRTSVSAEAFGLHNKKQDFKAPHYPKSEEIKTKLKERLDQAFMFSALNPEELEVVIGAMQVIKKKKGDRIITEGEDGNDLYVVESGVLTCTKIFKGSSEPTFLKEYNPGDAFGELALLYNCPRAATIEAKTDAELWSLDRNTFNYIVKDASAKKREKYEEFLKNVKILSNMDSYERSKLADALKEKWFEVDEFVIKEGEEGNVFYMVMRGEAVATKTFEPGKPPQEVFRYYPGDYFGERALLQNEPRAANIIAVTRLQVVEMDRHSFKRLLGSIDEILKRNLDLYKQYI